MESIKPNQDILFPYKRYLPFLVFIFAALLYSNTANHSFALDDYSVILEHQHVKNGWDGIGQILTTNYRNGQQAFNDGLYRPLSLVSFAAEQELFGGNPRVSHIINLLLYAFSCLLLFVGLQKVSHSYPILIPLAAVLLFASHPLHTEVVANIKGRDDLFSLLGFAATLYFSIKLLESKKAIYWIVVLLSYLLALFSKESSVVYCGILPLILLLDNRNKIKDLIPITVLFALLSIGFFFLRLYIINSMPNPVDEGNFGLLNNPIAAIEDLNLKWGSTFALQFLFLKKLILPHPLIHDYSYNQIPLNNIATLKSITGLLILIGLIACSFYYGLKRNAVGIILAIYLLLILIPSQLIMKIGVHFAERLLFMPVLAFSMFLVYGLSQLTNSSLKKFQKQLLVGTIFILVPYSAITIDRNKDWKNNLTLYEADIEKAASSARANYNLGTELSEMATLSSNTLARQKMLQRSKAYLEKALEIYPDYIDAANNLGIVYKRTNEPAKAVELYLNSINKNPTYLKNYYNLATVYFELKQYENCIISMQEFVNRSPNNASAYLIMGQAAGNMNQFGRAATFLNQSLSIQPNNLEALNFLGMAYGIQKEFKNAESTFLKILQFKPNDEQTLLNLSINYHQQGKLEEEVKTLMSLLKLNPNNQAALRQISLALNALDRSAEAEKYSARMQ